MPPFPASTIWSNGITEQRDWTHSRTELIVSHCGKRLMGLARLATCQAECTNRRAPDQAKMNEIAYRLLRGWLGLRNWLQPKSIALRQVPSRARSLRAQGLLEGRGWRNKKLAGFTSPCTTPT